MTFDQCKNAISKKLDEYRKVEAESATLDQEKLSEARQAIRPAKESEAIDRIEKAENKEKATATKPWQILFDFNSQTNW